MQVQQAEEGSITPIELQAELDTLRSLRRRSISQPSEGIDPDLPPSPTTYPLGSPPGSPKQLHHVGGPSDIPTAGPSGTSSSGSSNNILGRKLSGSLRLSSGSIPEEDEANEDQPLADNLSELFWLPARLHPEIAPQEFRNFIRDQTKPENLLRRSGSQLGRRKSMLSRQYQPSDTETESTSLFTSDADSTPSTTPSISRRPSRAGSFRRSTGLERLTLADLQKLETIARQAAEEGQTGEEGEAQLKRLVRRSLSLNPAAILGAADQLHDDDTYVEDDTDSPLIVPPPGSILRRSARTKIRKNSLLGDGNGHRFGPSRRSSKGLDAAMEDDPNRPVQGKRQASISSVNSLEDERKTPSGERPTSAELRRRSPRSPEKAQPAPEPLPPQYMPSTGITLAQQMDAADLGPQEPDRLTLSPGRVGADIPAASQAVPQQLQWTSTAQLGEGVTSPRSIGPVTGSLRTTKRIGTQLQPSPEVQPRTSSAAATASRPVAGPGPLQLPVSPDAPTLQLFEEPEAARASPPSGADARPALPMKRPSEAQQGDRQTLAPAQEPKPAQREPSHIPRPTKPTSAPFQESPKTAPASSLPSQPARKTPASPVQASAPSKEKEKKSTWAKLGLSRSSKDEPEIDDGASIASNSSGGSSTFGRKGKKTKKDKLQTEISPEKKQQPSATLIEKNEKPDSSSSFFGGLFGKKKAEQGDQPKKDGSTTPIPMQMPTPPPTASGMLTPDGKYINFYRLPIHIERAVYRLSHIKLANPRRPLYEQVLISNLMFWYLGVINKPVAPPSQVQQRQPPPQQQQPIQHQPLTSPPGTGPTSSMTHQQPQAPASGAPPARPALVRDHSSNSGSSHFEGLLTGVPMDGFSVPENEVTNGQRPASHPSMTARSPPGGTSEPDYSLRPRPQTMPPGQTPSLQPEASRSPPKTDFPEYRYQDYISTTSSEAEYDGRQKGPTDEAQIFSSTSSHANDRSNGTSSEDANPQPRRFSSEQSMTDDVRYDSRRITADMDTYDIISAYADEERRKSLLAQQSAAREPRSPSPPTSSASHRNAQDVKMQSERVHEHAHHQPAHRATPPRQSSVGAVSTHGSHQHPVAQSPTTRHAIRSPPPRSHSPHSLPTQS